MSKKEKKRICISGPSGVGKTTLAKYIEQGWGIPFITCSTKPLWGKHGINSHEELIKKTTLFPQWGLDFQDEVLNYRTEILRDVDEFVTDRSPWDNLVYFFLQNLHLCNESEVEKYMYKCNKAMNMFNGLIYIPYNHETILENDRKRIANKYYQDLVNQTFYLCRSANYIKYSSDRPELTLRYWDFSTRINQLKNWMNLYYELSSYGNIPK